jgi:hypothetical protein
MQRILITILACLLLVCAVNGGEVQVHSALRAMFHEGQTGTMVTLDTMLPNPDLYAVGALADLSKQLGAALLVAVEVPAWHSITTESAIHFEDIDEAVSFPLGGRVRGTRVACD